MAFPKRHSRRIVVAGETYIWYLNGKYAWYCGDRHIAIGRTDPPHGQLLLLDVNASELEIRPGMVRNVIVFARANGWTPTEKAAPLYVGHDKVRFILLPPGEQYAHEFPDATASPFNPDAADGRVLFAGPGFENNV